MTLYLEVVTPITGRGIRTCLPAGRSPLPHKTSSFQGEVFIYIYALKIKKWQTT
ncbi:MAG TPA: hypothetical protein VLR49_05955 [Ferruginibacter sp.]|nr:hypothetical protein [Ferruginibacter sp.]